MEQIILNILEALRRGETVDDKALVKLIHAEARREGADKRDLAKRRLLPFYQRVKREEPARWTGWNVDAELERRLLQVLRMKPRRTASGVATITVITKPWPCSGDCLFCPNDLRMPKSYLHAEPACARAEQNYFDPYLQVSARLTALSQMGHATDKIELIVLGGTWSDYPQGYQAWFMSELFRALNDDAVAGVAANPMLARPGISRAEAGRLLDDAPADALPPERRYNCDVVQIHRISCQRNCRIAAEFPCRPGTPDTAVTTAHGLAELLFCPRVGKCCFRQRQNLRQIGFCRRYDLNLLLHTNSPPCSHLLSGAQGISPVPPAKGYSGSRSAFPRPALFPPVRHAVPAPRRSVHRVPAIAGGPAVFRPAGAARHAPWPA